MAILKIKDNNNVWHIIRALKGKDGVNLEFDWNGTKLGIKTTEDKEFNYVDLKGEIGKTGTTGLTGNGIKNIEKISTKDNVDTYAINFTDGTKTTFEVTNGEVSLGELKEVDSKVESNYEEFDNLKSELLSTSEAQGSFICVEDSYKDKLLDFSVGGVLKQNTTAGKNKFDPNVLQTRTHNGITLSIENNVIHVSGESTGASNFYLKNDVNFTLKAGTYVYHYENFASGIACAIRSETDTLVTAGTNNVTFTLENDTLITAIILQVTSTAGKVDRDLFIQIEPGQTATDYEPFTGGEPSPSPNFSQEIETITDNLKIMSFNKNLINKNLIDRYYSYTYGSVDTIPTKQAKNNGRGTLSPENAIIIYPNTNYVLTVPNGIRFAIAQMKSNFVSLGDTGWKMSTNSPYTIKTNQNAKYIAFNFSKDDNSDFSEAEWNDFINGNLQLEQNSTATSFVEHLENMININLPVGEFIGKIDDTYKDELKAVYNEEEGQYHLILNKNIIKIVMDGDINKFIFKHPTIKTDTNGFYQFRLENKFIGNNGNVDLGKSNYLIYQAGTAQDVGMRLIGLWWESSSNSNYASIPFTTLDDANNWLKQLNSIGEPLEIYYVTSKPYQVDLGPIGMLKTYNGVTNIFTDSDLLPNIRAKYYQNFEETIKKLKINEKSLKDELQSLSERLGALETKQAVSSDNSNLNVENEVIS